MTRMFNPNQVRVSMLYLSRLTMLFAFLALPMLLGARENDARTRLWVKAQGRLDGQGNLLVEKIRRREPGKRFVLEGIVEETRGAPVAYRLAGFTVIPVKGARYAFINGEKAAATDVRAGGRIKAIGFFKGGRFYAGEIRVFQYSRDDDVEVEGPVEGVRQLDDGGKLLRVGSMRLIASKRVLSGARAPRKPSWLSRNLVFKGKLKMMDNTREIQIPEEDSTTFSRRYARLQGRLWLHLTSSVYAYGRLELFWRNRPPGLNAANRAGGFEFRLRDLYLSFGNLVGITGLEFRIGRQRFRDVRTWLMDRRFEALQILYTRKGVSLSVAYATRLNKRDRRADQTHIIGRAYYRWARGLKTIFTVIKELDQRPGAHDPLWLALAARGKIKYFLEYWAQGARYSSQDGPVKRLGYGYDAGVLLRPLGKGSGPFVSFHLAYGSADDPRTDTVRERFRQPPLKLNYYKYGDWKRLFYYGSLLTPELSNLRFQAWSAGYRFSRRATLQGMWRTYTQVRPVALIRSNSLGVEPNGLSPDLGNDAEILLQVIPWNPLQIAVAAEWFFPGQAFGSALRTTFGLRTEIFFYF